MYKRQECYLLEQTGADDDAGKTNDYRTGPDGDLKASLLLCIDTAA